MGPKKKPAGAAGGEGEEDRSTENFHRFYKNNCQKVYEIPQSKAIQQLWNAKQNDEITDFEKFHLWEQLGWQGVRAIFDALKQAKYQHAKSVRLWKTGCEDEGVRSICEYLKVTPNVLLLELLDNGITKLGCEFISRILHPDS